METRVKRWLDVQLASQTHFTKSILLTVNDISSCSVIVRVSVVLKRTVGDSD